MVWGTGREEGRRALCLTGALDVVEDKGKYLTALLKMLKILSGSGQNL